MEVMQLESLYKRARQDLVSFKNAREHKVFSDDFANGRALYYEEKLQARIIAIETVIDAHLKIMLKGLDYSKRSHQEKHRDFMSRSYF